MASYKKIIFSLVLVFVTFTGLSLPRPADAFIVSVAHDVTGSLKWIWDKVEKVYDTVQGIVGAELSNKTVGMFMDSLAYDVATELATGAAGGKPLFRTTSIKQHLQNAQDKAFGEFLGELTTKGFDELGINLCDPSIDVKLTLTLALLDEQKPPKPKCDWRNVQREWKNFEKEVQSDIVKFHLDPKRSGTDSTKEFFQGLMDPENSDLGALIKLETTVNNKKIEAKEVEELSASECQGFIDKATTVIEAVKTHCSVAMNMSEEQWDSAVENSAKAIAARKEAATNRKLSDILKDAGSRFVDTFTSKLMKEWIKDGMWSLFGGKNNNAIVGDDLLARLRGGYDFLQPRGQDLFKDLKKIRIEKIESFDYLNEFAICPSQFKKPDNCVMSPAFLQAVNSQMTLKQAIEDGVIDGQTPLIGPNDPLNHSTEKCYRDGLCYGNLVKLRKANIVPVGWELAAIRGPVSLQQAMDCFEESLDCRFPISDKFAVDGNQHNPFYHLIDPDWVLKAPSVLCDAYVNSSVLESSDSSNRQQYCADAKICLREDDDGNCLDGQYGYCTRTENIWRFEGDKCPSGDIYAGCLTFKNEDLGEFSYVEDSLDYCTADQAGCRRYSQEKDFEGNWILDDIRYDDNDLFLNKQANICSSDQAGCDQYILMAPDLGVNLVPNSGFGDINDDGTPDGWSSVGFDYNGDRIANGYAYGGGLGVDLMQRVELLPNTMYQISVDMEQYTPESTDQGRITMHLCDASGTCGDTSIGGAIEELTTCDIGYDGHPNNIDLLSVPSQGAQRAKCTFMTNENTKGGQINISSENPVASSVIWFDNLKLEIVSSSNSSSVYTPYGQGGYVYMDSGRFMCLEKEVGCQGYTPINGDPMIPAVINSGDLCPNECVGYDTFSEQPDLFDIMEGDTDVRYFNFIPDTANSCPETAVGCEEFTNLDVLAEGGEGREYYTFLRQCVPSEFGAAYYTWEGSDVAGYQIKTWYILESNISDAPCTNIDPHGTDCRDNVSIATCDVSELDTNPNCRQFFDQDGDSHMRLQDRVVFASDNCHDYRRTLTGTEYSGLPSESISCTAANNNCRSYYGNNANNIRMLFIDNFEGGTYSPWGDGDPGIIDLSSESLNDGGHSLKLATGHSHGRNMVDEVIKNNKEYQVSWWMKSSVSLSDFNIRLFLEDANNNTFLENLNDAEDTDLFNIEAGNWHYYTISKYLDISSLDMDNIDSQAIILDVNGPVDGDLFIDNFTFKEISDSFSVIRDSWQTPTSCDTPYEGYHLGCQTYIDTNARQFDLKSFNYLCREQAIGCTPVIDTHNSSYPYEETFHLGDYSEITVPSDSINYLVPDPKNYCLSSVKGCSELGLPDREDATLYSSVYKINDPDRYNSSLCTYEALNCEEFASGKGTYYFKDPGSTTCTYQENILISGSLFSGWFLTATLSDETPMGCLDTDQIFDIADLSAPKDYCHAFGDPNSKLNYFTIADCQQAGGEWFGYGLASQCPAIENMCTAFIDPTDPVNCDPKINNPDISGYCSDPAIEDERLCNDANETWTPSCEAYYYINDEQIDETSCNGTVDKQNGCVLFYDANSWNGAHDQVATLYDSQKTYDKVEADNFQASPIVCNPSFDPTCTLDANKLIKVRKDRQCSEWLTCKSSSAVLDPDTQEYRIVCDDLDSCIEFEYDSNSNITRCKRWESYANSDALTYEKYQSRDSGARDHMTWGDMDYIGYAVPDTIPVNELSIYDFGTTEDPQPRLVYDAYDSYNVSTGERYFSGCVDADLIPIDDISCTATINTDGDYFFNGECQQGICWVSPKANQNSTSTFSIETRGYALSDAPFPAAIAPEGLDRLAKYNSAAICTSDESYLNGCEESFVKTTYGYGDKVYYYPADMTAPNAICTSGDIYKEDGSIRVCIDDTGRPSDSICDTRDRDLNLRGDGVCSEKTQAITFKNWPGICLEYDLQNKLVNDIGGTFYCNQWYPADKIKGTSSLYDNYTGAGYYEPSGQDALFCAIAEPFELTEDRIYCGQFDNFGDCNYLIRVPAGARINVDKINEFGDLLDRDYLKIGEVATWYPYTSLFYADANNRFGLGGYNIDGTPNPATGSYNQVGLNRIENSLCKNSNCSDNTRFNKSSHFKVSNPGETANAYSLSVIKQLFDTTHDAGIDIEIYFYDERINSSGNYNPYASINSPNGYPAIWGPECDLEAQPSDWVCGQLFDSPNPYSGDENRVDSPEGNYHQVYSNSDSGEGARGGVYNCSSGCGINKSKVCRNVYCNPLSYNYYAEAQYYEEGPLVCTDYNCSAGLDIRRGYECIYSLNYVGVLGSNDEPWGGNIKGFTSIDQCQGYATCEAMYCIENYVDLTAHNATGVLVEDPADTDTYISESTAGGVVYCSQFGSKNQGAFSVNLNDGTSCTFNNIIGLDGCHQYIYDLQTVSIFDQAHQPENCNLWGDVDNNNILSSDNYIYNGPYNYTIATVKDDHLMDWLYTHLFGETDGSGTVIQEGCLEYGGGTDARYYGKSANANCTQTLQIPDFSTYNFRDRTFQYYPVDEQGTDCDGSANDNPLNCFQQCKTISYLDSQGDLSFVRTDIWWRNKETGDRVIIPRWESYYYTAGEYQYINDVKYDHVGDVGGTSIGSHFGAGLGIFDGNEIVSTRVPLNNYVTDLSAATFFSWEGYDSDEALVWAHAVEGLTNLFAKVYNMQWNSVEHIYEFDNEYIISGPGNFSNVFAGGDYNPRVLAACGDRLCELRDSSGNVKSNITGITVNGAYDDSSGALIGTGGALFTDVKFFYHAHPDHMPVYSVDIDWGDGAINAFVPNPGKYKNNLPSGYCDPNAEAPAGIPEILGDTHLMGFGGLDRACQEGYKVFYHDYQYDPEGAHRCDGIGGAAGTPPEPVDPDASCYQPRVRVTDRWGWNTIMPFNGWIMVYDE
ncbi:hypothetical protein KKH39_02260 [Patescibacteria group bacterium]|nr:hypothetical protein [Patescibacteria group bacterium]